MRFLSLVALTIPAPCQAEYPPPAGLSYVQIEDRFRFGPLVRERTLREWQFLYELECGIENLCAVNRLLRKPVPSFAGIVDLRRDLAIWNAYDNLADWSEIFEAATDPDLRIECIEHMIENLTKLRDLIGPEDYAAGRLPDVQRWRLLEAMMTVPIP